MPPISKNTIVNRSDLDGHLKKFAVAIGILSVGWRCLLASYFVESFQLTADHIKWCLTHGLLVSKCHLLIRYNREIPLTDFIDFVRYNRRLGDADVDKTVIAQTSKLIGNSAYRIQLINKAKFDKTVHVIKLSATKNINSAQFKSYDVIDRKIYEKKMSKKNNLS